MGRKRTKNHHLPHGVTVSNGAHYWIDYKLKKWHRLGKEWDKRAKDEWVRLTTGKAPDGTVAELLDAFLDHCERLVREGKRSSRTHDVNLHEAEVLKKVFGRMHYKAVTSKHIASYLRHRTYQPKRKEPDGTITLLPAVAAPVRANREIALLSSAYAWGMGEENYDIVSNPCYGVRRNTERPRTRYVDTRELRQFTKGVYQADGTLKQYVPIWIRVFALLKRLTALPQSDLLELDESHITERGIVYVRNKTQQTDGVPVIYRWTWALRIVVAAARKLRPEPPKLPDNVEPIKPPAPQPLFPTRYGTLRTASSLKTPWQNGMVEYARDGFKRFWEHDIRAKVASDAVDIEHARQMLNHATQATTKRYRRGPRKVQPAR